MYAHFCRESGITDPFADEDAGGKPVFTPQEYERFYVRRMNDGPHTIFAYTEYPEIAEIIANAAQGAEKVAGVWYAAGIDDPRGDI